MIEPLVMQDNAVAGGGYMVDGDTDKIITLVRQARELGADLIKADPTDDVGDYHRVVEVAGDVPVLVRGGGRVDDRTLLERTAAVLAQGARGIVYGRNVIQHENPAGITRALMAVLHDGHGVDDALELVGGAGVSKGASKTVNVAIVGGGLMGREMAAALQRWPALIDHPVRPQLTAVCDINPAVLGWFDQIPTVTRTVTDYAELLDDDKIDVVYVAVRHDLHERLYVDTIAAGKSLLAEKPFGIDASAARAILAAAAAHPDVVRPLLQRDAVLPGRAARDRLRPIRGARTRDRGPVRVPARQRPGRAQADQLETPGPLLRRGRRDERPGPARLARAAAVGLAPGPRVRRPVRHRDRAAHRGRRPGGLRHLGQRDRARLGARTTATSFR